MMKIFLISWLIMVFINLNVNGDVYEYQLINDLFQSYSSKVRPSLNYSIPTKVFISVALNQIIDVDEKNQMITVYIWLTLYWFDPMLRWNPANYNNLTDIVVPASDVWKPDVSMNNPTEKVIVNNDYENVKINYAGIVQWFPNGAFKLYCEIHAEYFPFDEQNCSLIFVSQSYTIYQLEFVVFSDLILNFYVNNTEWDLINSTAIKNVYRDGLFPIQDITFTFIIRRKPMYHIMSFVLPCLVTLGVSFLAFFLPAGSGEKMSVSITCLLSLLVLLLVISDLLPPNSNSFPLIGVLYSITIALNACISVISVFILDLNHFGENGKPVPRILQKIFFSLFGSIIMFPKLMDFNLIRSKYLTEEKKIGSKKIEEKLFEKRKNVCTDYTMAEKSCSCFKGSFKSNKIASSDPIEVDEKDEDQAQLQWSILADIIERLLFYVLFFVAVLTLLFVVSKAPLANIFR